MPPSVTIDGPNNDREEEEENTVDIFDFVAQDGLVNRELSPRSRLIVAILGFLLVSSLLYVWNAGIAEDEVLEDTVWKTVDDIEILSVNNSVPQEPPEKPTDTQVPTQSPIDAANAGETQPPVSDDDVKCNDICEKRETNRKTKFGGDLLDPKDVLRLAKAARDETIALLREDYGKYFDGIFVKASNDTNPNAEPSYYTMKGVTRDGPSRGRLKRKLKLKVLKMMHAIRTSESNVIGCDCVNKKGTPNGPADDALFETPDYYEKYVFANGGHSQAAGHGNKFSESYTAFFERDVQRVWGAIGVETIARNMAMGAMQASPDISTCSKEIFGADLDLLAWNYAMTDSRFDSMAHYLYRGATNPGRPALLLMTWGPAHKFAAPFEEDGLAMFEMNDEGESMKSFPDSEPGGIPLKAYELARLPKYVKTVKCNNRMGGKESCFGHKWSCTSHMRDMDGCICPNVGKRSSWHMGYQMHALHGHYIGLPFLEILIEALNELSASAEDTAVLLEELQKEEDAEYEAFLSKPILNGDKGNIDKVYGELGAIDGELMETWFKGPSLCRTSLLPAMSRYLGLTTNTNATGDSAPCGKETYETGIPFNRKGGVYTYTSNRTPTPGEFNLMAPNDFRSRFSEEECPVTIMPDYKDWFMAPWKDGKASITFPNEREKAHYGYEHGKFKGILGLISTLFNENLKNVKGHQDIDIQQFPAHVRMTVNGKPVKKYRIFKRMAILEDEHGSVYWEPSANSDYVLEFRPVGTMDDGIAAAEKHFRLQGFVLY